MKSNNKRNKAKKVKVAKEIDFKLLQDEMQKNNKYRKPNKRKKSRANKR